MDRIKFLLNLCGRWAWYGEVISGTICSYKHCILYWAHLALLIQLYWLSTAQYSKLDLSESLVVV